MYKYFANQGQLCLFAWERQWLLIKARIPVIFAILLVLRMQENPGKKILVKNHEEGKLGFLLH